MTGKTEKWIADAIHGTEEFHKRSVAPPRQKPRLLIDHCNPDQILVALRDVLADAGGRLFDRGVPVRLAHDQTQGGAVARVMTPDALIPLAHMVCRPYEINAKGSEVDVRLPRWLALMYLDWWGEWDLPLLNGIATAPG
jgi:hypothetical protein